MKATGRKRKIMSGRYMAATEWYEFITHTNYSFNIASSTPAEMVETAVALGYSSIGICDYDGVYGIIQAYKAKKKLNWKPTKNISLLIKDMVNYELNHMND